MSASSDIILHPSINWKIQTGCAFCATASKTRLPVKTIGDCCTRALVECCWIRRCRTKIHWEFQGKIPERIRERTPVPIVRALDRVRVLLQVPALGPAPVSVRIPALDRIPVLGRVRDSDPIPVSDQTPVLDRSGPSDRIPIQNLRWWFHRSGNGHPLFRRVAARLFKRLRVRGLPSSRILARL